MNVPTNNRTLAFLQDFGTALRFLWNQFSNRLVMASWWKVLLIGAFVFLVAGMFEIANMVGLLVLLVMVIKVFTASRHSANI